MTSTRFGRLRLALAPAAAVLLAACVSVPVTNPALDEARALYDRAAGDADVARSAPLELRSAQQALTRAEAAFKSREDTATVEHYAYLARQRSATALQAGEIAMAEQAVAASGSERDRILMQARSREAEQALSRAEQERAKSERAHMQAQASTADADAARKAAGVQLAAAQSAEAKAARLQSQLSALEAKQTERGMVLTLGDVLFDTGQAELKPGAFSTIDRLATFMRENPERTLAVEGYTDSVGGEAYNLSLSQRRADAVRAALLARGVDGARITTNGMGKASPVASNDTASGRQRNRRVEIVISGTG